MKNLSILFALTVICFGCEKDYDTLIIEQETLLAPWINETYEVGFRGGSGSFDVSTDNPPIADVTIGAGNVLRIVTKQEGSAEITVIDKKSGGKVECMLIVRAYSSRFKIVSMQYAVDVDDADIKTAIEEELETPPYPIGSVLEHVTDLKRGEPDHWTVKTEDGVEITSGTVVRVVESKIEFLPSYSLLPIKKQMYFKFRYNIELDGKQLVYDMFNVSGYADTRLNSPPLHISHARFYENLTDYYKNKYPDAGVNGVVRVQQCNYY